MSAPYRRVVAALAAIVLPLACAWPAGAAGAEAAQRAFASPEKAAAALVAAAKADDQKAALAILGPSAGEWIRSGDATADAAARAKFVAAYDEKHAIERAGATRATLTVGADDWPFAFPLVRTGSSWRFDTAAGKKELLARRIGANELAAINVMLAIVDAQREYASADRESDGVRGYARVFASTPGRRDGLYWTTAPGEPPSPLGELVQQAAAEGYAAERAPYHGYYFRMLTGQGPHARGGTQDYIVHGRMIGGFAAIAYPAQYRNSGVMTFVVNHDGVVYQKDLGTDTAKLAAAITRFDPGPGWAKVQAAD
jgi:hypothetical protein